MSSYYTTGAFSKLANVTERAVRYYDKIGLLKPSFIMDNGYRQYCNDDLLKLQKIISLKQLGFSIEEIFPLLLNGNHENVKESFLMQSNLVEKRITQLQRLNEALKSAANTSNKNTLDWNKIMELVQLTNAENQIAEQYKNTMNLEARMKLHELYSTNAQGWFNWLFAQLKFAGVYRLLEIGCGNGALWSNQPINLRNREIFLSDVSSGMVEEVREKLGKEFNCIVVDCAKIPFKDTYFDSIVANHVLFYLQDIHQGLEEIHRVMRKEGMLYCSTYGKNHMKEINELVKEFDKRITLSQTHLYDRFGLENGKTILNNYFSKVEIVLYDDELAVSEIQPLIDYILSCHGNQNEILSSRLNEFRSFLMNKMNENGHIKITKEAGLFICQK